MLLVLWPLLLLLLPFNLYWYADATCACIVIARLSIKHTMM